jgi:hypothetical protein
MFEGDCAVLFFSIHRYDGGKFFPGGVPGHYSGASRVRSSSAIIADMLL